MNEPVPGAYVKGVDVSRWQPQNLNWKKMRETHHYQYVFIKVTQGSAYGTKHMNACKVHALNAKEAGFKIGYYHYAEPSTGAYDASDEAAYFIANMRDFPKADFPPVLDIEDPGCNLTDTEVAAWILEFKRKLNEAGKEMILYSYTPWLTEHLPDKHGLHNIPLWVAAYPKVFDIQKPPKLPKDWSAFVMWQYAATEKVPVLKGADVVIDTNIMHPNFWLKYAR